MSSQKKSPQSSIESRSTELNSASSSTNYSINSSWASLRGDLSGDEIINNTSNDSSHPNSTTNETIELEDSEFGSDKNSSSYDYSLSNHNYEHLSNDNNARNDVLI